MGEIQNKGLALNVDIFNDKGKPIKNSKGELKKSIQDSVDDYSKRLGVSKLECIR